MRALLTVTAGLVAVVASNRALAPHELSIVARDFAFDAPDTVAAGMTTVHLENRGPDLHHVVIARLDGGHTKEDFGKAMAGGPLPAWLVLIGGPNAPAPGASSSATLDLAAGNYVITCLIPAPDGQPHFMKGMTRSLVVVGAHASAALPATDATWTLVNYGFNFSQPVRAGSHVIRVRNLASQAHEVVLLKLLPGKSAHDVATWMDNQQGPPPAVPIGGISPMAAGREAAMSVVVTPGDYALFCFVPDAQDGKPHVEHGMVRQITVP